MMIYFVSLCRIVVFGGTFWFILTSSLLLLRPALFFVCCTISTWYIVTLVYCYLFVCTLSVHSVYRRHMMKLSWVSCSRSNLWWWICLVFFSLSACLAPPSSCCNLKTHCRDLITFRRDTAAGYNSPSCKCDVNVKGWRRPYLWSME